MAKRPQVLRVPSCGKWICLLGPESWLVVDGIWLWESKRALVSALESLGFSVTRGGLVQTKGAA